MSKKKAINDRCLLQSDCECKCDYVGSECNCDFFKNNLTFEIEDAANLIILERRLIS